MAQQIIPYFAQPPEGLAVTRHALLPGVTSLDAVRAANACRYEASRLRIKLVRGLVPDIHMQRAEEQIVSFMLMERTLATLCGALRAAERQEADVTALDVQEAPHVA